MSSILKALKRLEDDFPKEKESPTWSQNIDTKGTIKRKSKSFFLSYKWMGLFGGAILLCVGAWFFFDQYVSRSRIKLFSKDEPAEKPDKITSSQKKPGSERSNQSRSKKIKYRPGSINKNRSITNRKTPGIKAQAVSKKNKSQSKAINIAPSVNSSLKLQAISWSQDPKKCIAVINGVIVREGETVEGFSVSHIGQDDVIVTKEGKDQRLMFNLK